MSPHGTSDTRFCRPCVTVANKSLPSIIPVGMAASRVCFGTLTAPTTTTLRLNWSSFLKQQQQQHNVTALATSTTIVQRSIHRSVNLYGGAHYPPPLPPFQRIPPRNESVNVSLVAVAVVMAVAVLEGSILFDFFFINGFCIILIIILLIFALSLSRSRSLFPSGCVFYFLHIYIYICFNAFVDDGKFRCDMG
jgi:hypothetical protein